MIGSTKRPLRMMSSRAEQDLADAEYLRLLGELHKFGHLVKASPGDIVVQVFENYGEDFSERMRLHMMQPSVLPSRSFACVVCEDAPKHPNDPCQACGAQSIAHRLRAAGV